MTAQLNMDVSEFVDEARLLHLRAVAALTDGAAVDVDPALAVVLCRLAVPGLHRIVEPPPRLDSLTDKR